MSIAGNLGPASMADALINFWAFSNLGDIQAGAYPGLSDLNTTFQALMQAPFSREPGGGVQNVQAKQRMQAPQMQSGRGQLAMQAGDLSNVFANILTQGASSLANINNMILQSRGWPSGGMSFLGGLLGGL